MSSARALVFNDDYLTGGFAFGVSIGKPGKSFVFRSFHTQRYMRANNRVRVRSRHRGVCSFRQGFVSGCGSYPVINFLPCLDLQLNGTEYIIARMQLRLGIDDLAAARARVAARRAISEALRSLPVGEWLGVLAEVLAEAEAPSTIEQSAALPLPSSASPTDRLLAALRERPGMVIGEVATRVYGVNDRTTHNRIRSMLASLRRQGRVRAMSRGQWEVVSPGQPDPTHHEKPGCRVLIEQVLVEHPGINTEELIRHVRELEPNANPQTINTSLSRLVQTRKVTRTGPRAGHYQYRLARAKATNGASGAEIVKKIVGEHPGLQAPDVIQLAIAEGMRRADVHTVLYRLKNRGEIVGEGLRGRTAYRLAGSVPSDEDVEEAASG